MDGESQFIHLSENKYFQILYRICKIWIGEFVMWLKIEIGNTEREENITNIKKKEPGKIFSTQSWNFVWTSY